MNTNRPLRTHENTLITWRDDTEDPYTKDHSTLRRYYTAINLDRYNTGLGYMTMFITNNSPEAQVEDFDVWERERGHGAGKMILRAAVAHLKSQDFQQLSSEEVGATALYVRRSVLGEDMHFYEKNDPQRTRLTDTFDDALRNAHHAERDRKKQTPLPELHVAHGILLDLDSVDTTGWTLPTAYDEYVASIPDLERH